MNIFYSFSNWFILSALGFSLSRTYGTYGFEFVTLVLVAMVIFLASIVRTEPFNKNTHSVFLKITVAFFLSRLLMNPAIYYAIPNRLWPTYWIFGIALLFTFLYFYTKQTHFLTAAFLLLSISLLIVPYISPNPQIDVYNLTNQANSHLLSGKNPYAVEYDDAQSKQFGYRPGYGWWPGALIVSAVASLVTDFRWAFAVSLILSAVFISLLALKFKKDKAEALLFGMLWLSFPVSTLIIEQAWVDPLLIVSASIVAWGLLKKNVWITGLALGYHISVKQYGLITMAVTALWLWKNESLKYAVKTIFISLVLFSIIVLPFIVANPNAFFQMAFLDIFGQAPRTDSFTIYALLKNTMNYDLADRWTGIVLLTSIGYFFIRWTKRKPAFSDWTLCLFVTTCLGFLFARRAFCNYFHFSAVFLVMYLLSLNGAKNESYR